MAPPWQPIDAARWRRSPCCRCCLWRPWSRAGFLGYGIYWVLSVVAFLFVITQRRIWFYLGAPVVVFLGLSLFVTYMGQRDGDP